jgi:hypothetical protein
MRQISIQENSMTINPITLNTATEHDIRSYLSQRGIISLQSAAGYIPRKTHSTIEIPPVADSFAVCADKLLAEVCQHEVMDANPRVPYLLLTWHLVGSDNEQRINQHEEHPYLIRLIALMSLYIACGALPQSRKLCRIADYAGLQKQRSESPITRTLAWTAEMLYSAATVDNREDVEEAAWVFSMAIGEYSTISAQAKAWCYMDDIEAGHITQKLILDCLE